MFLPQIFNGTIIARLIDKTCGHTNKDLPVIIGNDSFDFIVDASVL